MYSDPTLFSDTIGNAWSKSRDAVCKALTQELGQGDLIAKGFTLYKMDCSMGFVSSLAITQQHYGSNAVSLAITVPGNTFAATSTQPSVAGSYADPRFSIAYDVELDADLTLNPLAISNATIHVKNVSLDSQNLVADIAKALDSFFTGGKYRDLAERTLTVSRALPVDTINGMLGSVQTPIAGYVNKYAEIGFWVRNGVLIVDFAPKPIANPGGGSVSGAFTWTKTGQVKIPNCSGFALSGNFENGPSPLVSPPGDLGSTPTLAVGNFSVGALVDRGDHYECPYTITGLPLALPTTLRATVTGATIPAPPGSGGGGHFTNLVYVSPVGWSDPIAPGASTPGKNFIVGSTIVQTKPFGTVNQQFGPTNPGDPDPSARLFTNSANVLDGAAMYKQGLATMKLGSKAQGIAQLQAAYAKAKSLGDTATLNLAASALKAAGAPLTAPPAASVRVP